MEVESPDLPDCQVERSRSLREGFTLGEIFVTNKETGERVKIMEFDFDSRDEVDIAFHAAGKGGTSTPMGEWTFYFEERVGEEAEEEEMGWDRDKRNERNAERAEQKLREALLIEEGPLYTAEDYYRNYDLELEDLPIEEHFKVVENQFHDFLFKYGIDLDAVD